MLRLNLDYQIWLIYITKTMDFRAEIEEQSLLFIILCLYGAFEEFITEEVQWTHKSNTSIISSLKNRDQKSAFTNSSWILLSRNAMDFIESLRSHLLQLRFLHLDWLYRKLTKRLKHRVTMDYRDRMTYYPDRERSASKVNIEILPNASEKKWKIIFLCWSND